MSYSNHHYTLLVIRLNCLFRMQTHTDGSGGGSRGPASSISNIRRYGRPPYRRRIGAKTESQRFTAASRPEHNMFQAKARHAASRSNPIVMTTGNTPAQHVGWGSHSEACHRLGTVGTPGCSGAIEVDVCAILCDGGTTQNAKPRAIGIVDRYASDCRKKRFCCAHVVKSRFAFQQGSDHRCWSGNEAGEVVTRVRLETKGLFKGQPLGSAATIAVETNYE